MDVITRILKVTKVAIPSLKKIAEQTFSETFAHLNSAEDMRKYLAENFNPAQLEKELSNPESYFFFAVTAGEIAGYLKLNFGKAQLELKEKNGMEIERLYVLREFHGKKVGQALFEKAIQTAQESDKDYIWLGVWENNQRAIRFYSKNGFSEFAKHTFMLGADKQTDIMMKKVL